MSKQPDADDGVDVEEGLVDASEVVGTDDGMFVQQKHGDGSHAEVVDPSEPRIDARQDREAERPCRRGTRRQCAAPGDAESGGNAVKPHLDVEIEVLAGVDDVEPGHPEHDGRAEHDRRPGNSPRMATQAAIGASINAAPSQKWARAVKRLVRL